MSKLNASFQLKRSKVRVTHCNVTGCQKCQKIAAYMFWHTCSQQIKFQWLRHWLHARPIAERLMLWQ